MRAWRPLQAGATSMRRDGGAGCEPAQPSAAPARSTPALAMLTRASPLRAARPQTCIGMSILDDLRSQRETLERSRERLAGADGDLTRGSRILRSMGIRAQANKTITVGIAAVAFIAIVLLFWWR